MDTDKHIVFEQEGDVTRVILNRPEKYNALTTAMIIQLRTFFEAERQAPTCRVILLESAGKHFCAGFDIDAIADMPVKQTDRMTMMDSYMRLIAAMRACPQPIVALVQGAAAGFGFSLVLASDIRYIADDGRMSVAMVKLGAPGCDLGISYFLPKLVGLSVATELMLTGDQISAEDAFRLGLVTKISTREALREIGGSLCQKLLACSPAGLRLTKQGLNLVADGTSLEQTLKSEANAQVIALNDTRDGAVDFKTR